jgi:hypothetical protein
LLDDLFPSGFFVASANPIKGKLQQYLTPLSERNRHKRIFSIRTRDVVDAQLLKSIIAVADYDRPTAETVTYRTEFRGHSQPSCRKQAWLLKNSFPRNSQK